MLASSLDVEVLLTQLYTQLPVAGTSVGYVDNFLALGKEDTEAVAISTAFGCALNAHFAGHLVSNPPKTLGPGQPIMFLGHRLQMCNGSVKIDPLLLLYLTGSSNVRGLTGAEHQVVSIRTPRTERDGRGIVPW